MKKNSAMSAATTTTPTCVDEDEDDAAGGDDAAPTGPDPAEVARRMEQLAASYLKFQKGYAKHGAGNKAARHGWGSRL